MTNNLMLRNTSLVLLLRFGLQILRDDNRAEKTYRKPPSARAPGLARGFRAWEF